MIKAIAASKKKSDRLDARKIADMARCDLLPACYVAPPLIRELRRLLRHRAGGADTEQNRLPADGSGRVLQQRQAAREEILSALTQPSFLRAATTRGQPRSSSHERRTGTETFG